MNAMNKPLAGIRVLELARILAGPWAGQLLADLGASVVKAERPGAGGEDRHRRARARAVRRALRGPGGGRVRADLGGGVVKVGRPGGGDAPRHWGPPFAAD